MKTSDFLHHGILGGLTNNNKDYGQVDAINNKMKYYTSDLILGGVTTNSGLSLRTLHGAARSNCACIGLGRSLLNLQLLK